MPCYHPCVRGFASLWLVAACGRIGYDPAPVGPDAPVADATIDAIPPCPPTMAEIPGSTACIDRAQRGSATWTNAKAACEALQVRLCTDQEWFVACTMLTELSGMAGDGYEWVAEEAAGIAQKRGSTDCFDMSEHEIFVDSYDYRCCASR